MEVSEAVITALIVSIPGSIAAIASVITAFKANKIQKQTNSMHDAIVTSEKIVSKAEGRAEALSEMKK